MYMLPLLCPSHLFQLAMNLGMRPGEKRITLYFVILYFFFNYYLPLPTYSLSLYSVCHLFGHWFRPTGTVTKTHTRRRPGQRSWAA